MQGSHGIGKVDPRSVETPRDGKQSMGCLGDDEGLRMPKPGRHRPDLGLPASSLKHSVLHLMTTWGNSRMGVNKQDNYMGASLNECYNLQP